MCCCIAKYARKYWRVSNHDDTTSVPYQLCWSGHLVLKWKRGWSHHEMRVGQEATSVLFDYLWMTDFHNHITLPVRKNVTDKKKKSCTANIFLFFNIEISDHIWTCRQRMTDHGERVQPELNLWACQDSCSTQRPDLDPDQVHLLRSCPLETALESKQAHMLSVNNRHLKSVELVKSKPRNPNPTTPILRSGELSAIFCSEEENTKIKAHYKKITNVCF